jgi:hypothetical protein
VDLLKFINILIVGYLALMQGKSLLFLSSRTSGNNSSFGKAAGKWITDKGQTIRFKLINNLILGIKKRINSKAYPLYL